ncbi:MAG: hypothetical protein HDT43_00700 [Ruminococcaceae bacterium]|nr:hypothetical protein [Oscillospiraceae bacterium]
MYKVSAEYKTAIAERSRKFRMQANIYLRDDTILRLTDSHIIGDVTITSQAMSGSASSNTIDIGAATSKMLTMTVKSPTIDTHIFSGARLWVYTGLKLPSDKYEDIPMGKFFIDSMSISREGNNIGFKAYDGMILLHYELTAVMRRDLKGKTAWEAAQYLCNVGLLSFAQDTGDLAKFPNSDLPLNFDSEQIEIARDAIMWIAQIMGCFARVNRWGALEFVQIKTHGTTEGDLGYLTARTIGGSERYSITFSDDRVHISGVTMRGADGVLVTKRYDFDKSSDTQVTVELEQNPLIMDSETPLADILSAILRELSGAYFYPFSAEIAQDPALDVGDTVCMEGGAIKRSSNIGKFIGIITHNTWVYHGHQVIANAGSVPIVFDGEDQEGENLASAVSVFSARSTDELNYLPPKDQSRKELQGKTDATKLVGNFGAPYVLKWNDPTKIVALDDKGKEMFSVQKIDYGDQFYFKSGENSAAFANDYIEINRKGAKIKLRDNGNLTICDKNGVEIFVVDPSVLRYRGSGGILEVSTSNSSITLNGKKVAFEQEET